MMMIRTLLLVLAPLVLVSIAAPAHAQQVEGLGQFKKWTAYRTQQGGKNLCYMASTPTKDEGKYTQRGKIYAMVSHRPATKALNVVSVHTGYTYKEDSRVTIAIGGAAFALFVHGDTAWASSAADDAALVKAMRAGSTMVIKGTSSRGTATTDTYSLAGFTAAHNTIGKACGL